VLGVAPARLRAAVMRALPRQPDGAPDPAAWSTLQAEVQARVRGLPTERSLRLARMREAALAGPTDGYFAPVPPWARHRRAAAAGVAAVTALALAATWWPMHGNDPAIRIEPLGRAAEPASRYSATTALIAHPDFDLLADPATERLARDAAFLAWTVGRDAVPPPPSLDDRAAPSVPETGEANDAP
jgi:hypothetical protein